nr:MAG: non-structural polyprotein [Pseudoscorpian dicistrovirus 3]
MALPFSQVLIPNMSYNNNRARSRQILDPTQMMMNNDLLTASNIDINTYLNKSKHIDFSLTVNTNVNLCRSHLPIALVHDPDWIGTHKSKYTARQYTEAMLLAFPWCIMRDYQVNAQIGIDINHRVSLDNLLSTEKIELMSAKLDSVFSGISWKSFLISLALCVRLVYKNWRDKETVSLALLMVVNQLGLLESQSSLILAFLKDCYQKICDLWTNRVTAQSKGYTTVYEEGIDFGKFAPFIGGPIALLMSVMAMRKIPGGDKFDTFLTRFSKVGGVIRSLNDVIAFGNDMLEKIVETINFHLFGCEKPSAWSNIDQWYEESMLLTKDLEGQLKDDPTKKELIGTLYERGLRILKTLDDIKIPMAQREHVSKMLLFLSMAREKASGVSAGQLALRIPPIIVHFFGNSGVGKSSLLSCLVADAQANLGVTDPADFNMLTYYRQPGRDFWDGYNNKTNVVVCDDFGAIKDNENKPNEEFLEAIRMSNTADYLLNMADLRDKGCTRFNAKLVIWTSNRSQFECKSLTNKEAVVRRVKRKFRQYPHPDFAKKQTQNGIEVQVLDNDKIKKKFPRMSDGAMMNCMLFDHVTNSDEVITAGMTFDEVRDMLMDDMTDNVEYHEEFNNWCSDYAAEAVKRAEARKAQKAAAQIFEGLKDRVGSMFAQAEPETAVVVWGAGGHFDVHRNLKYVETPLADLTYLMDDEYHTALYDAHCVNIVGDNFAFYEAYATAWYTARHYEQTTTHRTAAAIFSRVFAALYADDYTICSDTTHRHSHEKLDDFFQMYVMSNYRSVKAKITELYCSYSMFESLVYVISFAFGMLLVAGVETITRKIIRWFFPDKKVNADGDIVTAESKSERRRLRRGGNKVSESYRNEKTKARKPVVQEGYDNTKVKSAPTITQEGYDNTKVKSAPTIVQEGYDNTKVKSAPTIAQEVYDNDKTRKTPPAFQEVYDSNKSKATTAVRQEMNADYIEAQGYTDQNAAEIVRVMYRNMYKLECYENGAWQHQVNLTIVKSRLALTNKHLLIKENIPRWRIRNASHADGIEFDLRQCKKYIIPDDHLHGRKDCVLIELPRIVEQHKDIVDKFMTFGDFARFRSLENISLIGHMPDETTSIRQYFSNDVEAVDATIEYGLTYDGKDHVVKTRKFFQYGIQTTSGDCGGVLVAFDKNFNNKIIGIHAGGANYGRFTGFGTPVSRELLQHMIDNIECYPDSKLSPSVEVTSELAVEVQKDGSVWNWRMKFPFIGNFGFFGFASPAQCNFIPPKSQIVESPVHGVIATPTMKPARMRPFIKSNGDHVDPMTLARAKASPAPVEMDRDLLDEATNHFRQRVCSNVNEIDRRVLTFDEGIQGIPGEVVYAPINRQTSPGFGWPKTGAGKTKWLGDSEYILDNPEITKAHADLKAKCLVDRPSVIWVDTLKDERRPIEKVDAGKTRLFSVGEMAFTILFRQYFMGFIAHMMRNKIAHESCVGVNVYSKEWDVLANKIQEVGKRVIAGDFANYDGTLNAEMLWRVLDVIEAFYSNSTEEERTIRRALWSEVVNSIHISGDVFYQWTHSQPSGCPITTILNCGYHSISARYVFLVVALTEKPEMADLSYYDKYVRHLNYGDDDLWNISDHIVGWFNQLTISAAYRTFGMEYTDEAKTGEMVESRLLSEVVFLKRAFRFDTIQCRFRAPLALETIREMPMWNRKTIDKWQLTSDVLKEAFH